MIFVDHTFTCIAVGLQGSGKTLAYSLPIIHRLLVQLSDQVTGGTIILDGKPMRRSVKALILAPTRELALQIADHIRAVVPNLSGAVETDTKTGRASPPLISIGAIVGGMSAQKQRRILFEKGVDILVATPGRLWDLIQEVRA